MANNIANISLITALTSNDSFAVIRDNNDGTYSLKRVSPSTILDNYYTKDLLYTKTLLDARYKHNNIKLVTVYKVSTNQPVISGGSYNFDTEKSVLPTSWSSSFESSDTNVWYSWRIYYSNGTASDWLTPTRLIRSNNELQNLITLVYSYTLIIYRASTNRPIRPTGGTYSFSTNTFTTPTGWSDNTDSISTNTIWISIKTFYSDGTSSTWSLPTKLVDIESIKDTIITNYTSDINSAISDLESTMNTKDNLISTSIDNKVTVNTSNLELDILLVKSDLQTNINSLNTTTTSNLNSAIATINETTKALKESIDSLNADKIGITQYDSLKTSIENLQTAFNQFKLLNGYSSLKSSIEELSERITTLENYHKS